MFRPGDPKVVLNSIASNGSLVIGEAQGSGTFMDGRPYENLYAFAIEFKDGKVYRLREYMDSFYVAKLQGLAK
jgi:ketosteroid isomerase-like protein